MTLTQPGAGGPAGAADTATSTGTPGADGTAAAPRTVRLTAAQALVRWMVAQRSELLDGTEVPLFAGVFAIFGHGNVLGLGTALHDVQDQLPTWRGQNEQGMALAAVGLRAGDGPPAGDGGDVARSARARSTWSPRPAWPTPTGCRCCCCPATRSPAGARTRCCSRSSTSATRRRRVNDAFRAVSRYFDRITRPEQLLTTLPQVARVLTDPADAGPVVLCLPQDVQAEEYDFPVAMFDAAGAPRAAAATRHRDALAEAAVILRSARAAAARLRRRRALLGCRRGGARAGRAPTACRSSRPSPAAPCCPHDAPAATAARSASSARPRPTPGRRGRRGGGDRHPAAGLHHVVVDAASRPTCGSSASTRRASTRSSTASHEVVGDAREAAARARQAALRRVVRRPGLDGAGRDREGGLGRAHRPLRAGVAPDGSLTYAQVVGVVNDAQRAGRLRAHLLRRHARGAARRLAQGR